MIGKSVKDSIPCINDYWNKELNVEVCMIDKKFMPSLELENLISDSMVKLDKEERALMEEYRKTSPFSNTTNRKLGEIISEHIEGVFTNLAKTEYITKGPTLITKDHKFTEEICNEIKDRLELRLYDAHKVFYGLYEELVKFLLYPRERNWGRIFIEGDDIKIKINKGAFSFPNLKDIDW